MSMGKVLSLGVLAWVAMGTLANAGPFSWSGGEFTWTRWSSDGAVVTGNTATSDPLSSGLPSSQNTPSAPTPTPTPTPTPAPAPSAVSSASSSSSSSSSTPAAFINFGNGAYSEAGTLTTGTIQPWYDSPSVQKVFGGVPNAQQQADFTKSVLADVVQTFQLSGLNPTFTLDPNAGAAHTLSVVSGASYAANPNAIGIADVGSNGFGFIDKLNYAGSVTDLEWAVAHNVSHELMHAFGVAVHEDQTGKYLDSAVATWPVLTDPNTVFSAAAVHDILAGKRASGGGTGAEVLTLAAENLPSPVPEPATLTLWGLGALAAGFRWKRSRRQAA